MINRARRVVPKKEPKPETLQIMRSREYKGSRIVRMENGDQYVILEKGGYIKADGLEHGMQIIDKSLEVKVEEQPKANRRPLRTSHNDIKEPEGPFGSWMKNPPENCSKRQKDDQGYWVEVVNCAFFCQDNKNCPVFLKIQEGAKERIRNSKGI